mgnify:CR=1 FL=1
MGSREGKRPGAARFNAKSESALAGFEAAVGLVDDIDAPTATNHAIVAMTALERLQRVTDLHGWVLLR